MIARPSSFSFKGQETGIPEIAAKLHVTHVLEGSVRKSGNRVRLTVRLAEAASNSQAWSETYDYELGDIFKIQEEIAGQVATALNATLAGGPAHDPKEAALEPFQRAEFFYNRRAEGDIVRAVKYYQKALSIDPEYARAWASLSGAYALLAFGGDMNREEALAKQGEAARKAVALDPELAVGYARLRQYYWDIGDRESAYRTLDRAIALDPNDLLVLTFLAGIAMRNGEVAGAISRYDRIVARDPRSAAHHANRGIFLQAAGRLDEAKAELETAKEFSPDLAPEIDLTIARILIVQKRFDQASVLISRIAGRRPGPRSWSRAPVLRTGAPPGSGRGAQSPRCAVGAADRHPAGRDLRVSWHERPGVRDSPGPAGCGRPECALGGIPALVMAGGTARVAIHGSAARRPALAGAARRARSVSS